MSHLLEVPEVLEHVNLRKAENEFLRRRAMNTAVECPQTPRNREQGGRVDFRAARDEELIAALTKEIHRLKLTIEDQQDFINNIIKKSNEYKESKRDGIAPSKN